MSRKASAAGQLKRGAARQLSLMALPCVLLVLVFNYVPMVGIILAFKDYNAHAGVFDSPWIGLDNFRFFFQSGVAWSLIWNTVFLNFLFIVSVTLISIVVSLLLNEIFHTKIAKLIQSVLFFPHFVSWIVVGYFVFAFLNADNGLLNKLLLHFGLAPENWYAKAEYWPTILTVISVWKGLGYFSLIYLAAMVTINPEMYEAIRIDGGNKFHEILHITLPTIRPIVYINLFFALGRVFYANFDFFNNVVKNNGQILTTSDVIDTYVYRAILVTGDFNMAAAVGLIQGVCGLALILLVNNLVRRFDKENALY